MNASAAANSPPAPAGAARRFVGPIVLLLAGASAFGWWWLRREATPEPRSAREVAAPEAATDDGAPRHVHFDKAKQAAAGVRVEPVRSAPLHESIVVTGKLAINQDRLAHVSSMVAGVLREVQVKLGEQVKQGQLLAVVDSKELGQAKLELVKDRLAVGFAKVDRQWAETIHNNTQALIVELEKEPPVTEVENRFRDQPMGDNRQLLVAGYAKYHQAKADFERLRTLREQQVGVEKDYIRAKADFESASATHRATLEQLKFTTKQRLLEADQKYQQALTAERLSRAQLLILGYTEAEIDRMDPLAEGEAVAHYPIRAPFDGTVVEKHAVLSEHVGPQHQLFAVTDLSRVWLDADVFEKDLAALARMSGKTLEFTTAGYPGRRFTAEVFHSGDAVEETTRAVRLLAEVENPERLLKPGMFVEATLPLGTARPSIQIPESAVVRDDDTYVFVARGAEEFERRTIRLGRTIPPLVEVVEGLREGEAVAVEGSFALKSEMNRELLAE